MRQYRSAKTITWALTIIVIMCLMTTVPGTFMNDRSPILTGSAQPTSWSLTLYITESTGTGNIVILGASSSASNGTDDLDLPEPPAPPQLPYVRAWFATPFEVPFNRLIHEYKHTPSEHMQWNLSILWVPEPGNTTSTTITIAWDPQQTNASEFGSIRLTENDTVVANMLTTDSFSYHSNGTLQQFRVIAQGTPTNDHLGQQSGLPILPITLGALIIIVVFAVFVIYRRKRTRK